MEYREATISKEEGHILHKGVEWVEERHEAACQDRTQKKRIRIATP